MLTPPHRIIHDPNVTPALRELFSQHPVMVYSGPETLGRTLHMLHFLPCRPETSEVEAALEALQVEGEVLP
jgi:hypothetical protein